MNPLASALTAEMFAGASAALSAYAGGLSGEVGLDLSGLDNLRKSHKVAVIRAAQRAAIPLKNAVIGQAQGIARTGNLAKSVGQVARIYAGRGVVTVIGPKMSFSRSGGKVKRGPNAGKALRIVPYKYAWLLEKGTKRSRQRPFLAPAWAAHGGQQYIERARAEIEAALAGLL